MRSLWTGLVFLCGLSFGSASADPITFEVTTGSDGGFAWSYLHEASTAPWTDPTGHTYYRNGSPVRLIEPGALLPGVLDDATPGSEQLDISGGELVVDGLADTLVITGGSLDFGMAAGDLIGSLSYMLGAETGLSTFTATHS